MLSEGDRAILEFEDGWWRDTGAKDPAIEFTLGLSAEVYYERLLAIVSTDESARLHPLTVARVRALIEPAVVEEAVS